MTFQIFQKQQRRSERLAIFRAEKPAKKLVTVRLDLDNLE